MRILQNGDDNITVYEYPADPIKPIKHVLAFGQYINIYGAFDIETTVLSYGGEDNGFMYVWQFTIGAPGGDLTVYVGRTWKDYQCFLKSLKRMLRLHKKKRLVIWVHFLAYEFQWLRSIGEVTRMFATAKRAPVVVEMDDVLEYRCSYKLSNMSLSKFTEQEQAQHAKQSDFDYLVKRYPDTYLSDSDLLYSVCDVLGLHESVAHIMRTYSDTLGSIPYTSTGYVRREARDAVQVNRDNHYQLIDTRLSAHEYKLCKSASRGGNVHANVLYVNQIIEDVLSDDRSSSYPAEMLAGLYPKGRLIEDRGRGIVKDAANILFIELRDVKLKPGVYFPYISVNKCERLKGVSYRGARFDNGRVLSAPLLYMACTEIDFEIIVSQYDAKITILEQYVSEYGYLCKEYRDFVYEAYKAKCKLKHEDPYFYAKYKNKVNALFGMMLTDITRENVVYVNDDWGSELPPVIEALNQYYKNYKSFLSYQDGIYVTANARKSLQIVLDVLGRDAIYCDTDSSKYIGDHSADLERINAAERAKMAAAGYKPVIIGDETYEVGVWERDAEYKRFVTQGAKKYAYEYSGNKAVNGKHAGEIGLTVAGLSKEKGAAYLREHGLESFLIDVDAGEIEGTVFSALDSGRMMSKYNDTVQLKDVCIDGHKLELTSNVALVPTTYTLSYTKDYADLIRMKTLV